MARVRLRGQLKRLAGDAEQDVAAADVAGLLGELERTRPALAGWVLDERGALRRHINVFVNGERADLAAPLQADDVVDVLPAISGGSTP